MRNSMLRILAGTALCLVATVGRGDDISWNGSALTADAADGDNWDGGVAPGSGDQAIVGSSPQSPDLVGQTLTWGRLRTNFGNDWGDTGGTGVLNLTGADDLQFFSEGGPFTSTIPFDIVATKNIQTNGTHSVTFNGDITARKIEAFGGSTATLNGKVTQTDEFMSIGGGSKVVINNEFYWNNGGHGINNNPTVELGAGAKLFRPDGGGGFLPGLDVFNLFNGATVRLLADNALGTGGETDLFSRNVLNTFDLNGNDQIVEFLGLGDAPTPGSFNVDFGDEIGANTLIWEASHQMNGTGSYHVLNFQSGDTLEFGQHGDNNGFHNPAILGRISINGAAYSATNPGTGPWWEVMDTPNPDDNIGRQIAVYHVPEPGALTLAALAALALRRRRTTILR